LLLKFAYQDFLDDRCFKNTPKTNIKNYVLGKFVDYCIDSPLTLVFIEEDKLIVKFRIAIRSI